ncbi:MAG: class B sortase, partial [Oscillospiraceae bacterium]|nr:class B sortase [Oscillospiraceae bacterium]
RNLVPLFEQNPDCIGWIYIEGTAVDYPVMHTPDEPQRYLRKNFEGEYAMSGVPFLEGTRELSDDSIVIYGHNMLNGTMFSDITLYTSRKYFDEHPVIEFETAEGVKLYDIFAVVMLKYIDIWYYFDSALNAEHFDEMISDITSRSLYETGIYPEYGKQLLTLSTCYGENDEDRIIIIGTEK